MGAPWGSVVYVLYRGHRDSECRTQHLVKAGEPYGPADGRVNRREKKIFYI